MNLKGLIPIWDPKRHTLQSLQKGIGYMFEMECLTDLSDDDCWNTHAKTLHDFKEDVFIENCWNCVHTSNYLHATGSHIGGLYNSGTDACCSNLIQLFKSLNLNSSEGREVECPERKVITIVLDAIRENQVESKYN